jgi:putative mRNA 3-end processing factor
VLFCYAFGKAQRVLAELHALGVREEVLLHGAMQGLMGPYRDAGIAMVPTAPVSTVPKGQSLAGRLTLAPPSAQRTPWMRRFAQAQTAFASGWMTVRGVRRRRGVGRGFVLSDHADWSSLVRTIVETGARRVYLTHGQGDSLARYLQEVQGMDVQPLRSGEAGAWSREEESERAGIQGAEPSEALSGASALDGSSSSSPLSQVTGG